MEKKAKRNKKRGKVVSVGLYLKVDFIKENIATVVVCNLTSVELRDGERCFLELCEWYGLVEQHEVLHAFENLISRV